MPTIRACRLPEGALLRRYLHEGSYADCYATDIARPVSHAQYVEAFYTSTVFGLERLILKWVFSRPSTDAQARQLADGKTDSFAAWRVEGRSLNQLLLADFTGRTRSWLMVAPTDEEDRRSTRLYFGSAVIPAKNVKSGGLSLGFGFRSMLGFHRLYSQSLLYAAKSRLESTSHG